MTVMQNRRGSLLLEIIIVIAIFGLILSFSVPYIRSFTSDFKLSKTGKALALDLRYAQQLTVSEQKTYYVHIFPATDLYQIVEANTLTVKKEENLPAEIEFQALNGFTDNKIIFNFYGVPFEYGSITLVNTQTSMTATVEIKPSGYVDYSS